MPSAGGAKLLDVLVLLGFFLGFPNEIQKITRVVFGFLVENPKITRFLFFFVRSLVKTKKKPCVFVWISAGTPKIQ